MFGGQGSCRKNSKTFAQYISCITRGKCVHFFNILTTASKLH